MEPLLIGRADEVACLATACGNVVRGVGGYVHIVGEAGIGKTSLLRAAACELERQRVTVLTAAADETDSRRSLAVVRRLCPELDDAPHPDPVDAVLATIELRASDGPIAVVVDDLHWADDASIDVVWALARRASDLGFLLVTTSRNPGATGLLARLDNLATSDGHRLTPRRLDARALAELVERKLGAHPGPRLAAALDGTAGNPFLATELLAALTNDGAVEVCDGLADLKEEPPLSGDLVRRLAARTLSVVPDADQVLRAIAVVPGGASPDEVAELIGRPLGETVAILVGAVDAGVLVDNGTSLVFRHDLLRRAVQQATPESVAHSLARRFADVLVTLRAKPDRVAACLVDTFQPGDSVDVDHLVALAREFRPAHPAAASDLFSLVIASLDDHDPRAEDMVQELGSALIAAGRVTEVRPLLNRWFGPYRITEPVEVARLRALAAAMTGDLDEVIARYADFDIDDLPETYDTNDPELVDGFTEIAMLRVTTGRFTEALHIVDRVEASPTTSSAFREAMIANVRSLVEVGTGAFESALERSRVAFAAAARDDTRRASTATPTLVQAVALDLLGDSDAALAVTRGGGRSTTPRWGPPMLQSFATLTLYRRGDWDDALAEVDAAFVAAEEAESKVATHWPSAVATLVCSARNQSGRAHEWLRRSYATGSDQSAGKDWFAYAAATLSYADGDVGAAFTFIDMLIDSVTEAGAPAVFLNGGAELVRMCRDGGRTDRVDTLLTALATVRRSTSSPVASAVDDWATGVANHDATVVGEAADRLLACRRVPDAARAFHHAAVEAVSSGDQNGARRLAKAASELYETFAADLWRHQLISDLRSVGLDVRPRRTRSRAVDGWASLTASEEAVVALLGQGLTNSEIAERLFVSRRTVESHLRRVYPKLRLTSRAQLLSAIARRPFS